MEGPQFLVLQDLRCIELGKLMLLNDNMPEAKLAREAEIDIALLLW